MLFTISLEQVEVVGYLLPNLDFSIHNVRKFKYRGGILSKAVQSHKMMKLLIEQKGFNEKLICADFIQMFFENGSYQVIEYFFSVIRFVEKLKVNNDIYFYQSCFDSNQQSQQNAITKPHSTSSEMVPIIEFSRKSYYTEKKSIKVR